MGTRPKIDINTAHVVQLTAVKGIGKSRAETIVRYRDKNGPFTSVDDLDRVPHIGDMPPDELLQVKTYFTVAGAGDTAPPTAPEQVDVNVAKVAGWDATWASPSVKRSSSSGCVFARAVIAPRRSRRPCIGSLLGVRMKPRNPIEAEASTPPTSHTVQI